MALGGAAFFFPKSATVLKVAGVVAVGADRAALLKLLLLMGVPSNSDIPTGDVAREAIFKLSGRVSKLQVKARLWWYVTNC